MVGIPAEEMTPNRAVIDVTMYSMNTSHITHSTRAFKCDGTLSQVDMGYNVGHSGP